MRHVHFSLTVLVAVFALCACKGEQGLNKAPQEGQRSASQSGTPDTTRPVVEAPDVVVMPHEMFPSPEEIIPGRQAQRLSVDHLRRTIPELLGRQWADGNDRSYFDLYSTSLGEADFRTVNHDVREVSTIFSKMMDDMAGRVCQLTVESDADLPEEERQIIRHEEDVDRTLRWLKLKFHGIYVPEGCDESIASLRTLHEEVEAACAERTDENRSSCPNFSRSARTSPGWTAVCVALITDPEFMAY